MQDVAIHVMTTVNAPFGTELSPHDLATLLADPKSADELNGPVFSFFSEISVSVQKQFLDAMGVDEVKVRDVADRLAKLSGYELPLAA